MSFDGVFRYVKMSANLGIRHSFEQIKQNLLLPFCQLELGLGFSQHVNGSCTTLVYAELVFEFSEMMEVPFGIFH